MEEDTGIFGKFDLMYGVTRAESFHMLSDAHAKMGFSVQHRNHLVNAYVRNNYENFVSLAGTTTHFCLLSTVTVGVGKLSRATRDKR